MKKIDKKRFILVFAIGIILGMIFKDHRPIAIWSIYGIAVICINSKKEEQ